MCPRRARPRALLVVGLILALAGCSEGPAEEAVDEAQAALEGAAEGLAQWAPEDLERLEDELKAAREALAEGRYTDALRVAQGLPERTRVAVERAAARRPILESAWESLSSALPDRLGRLRAHLRAISPDAGAAGDDPSMKDARVRLRGLQRRWAEAGDAFQSGQLARAVAEAQTVDAALDELSNVLGCGPGC